MRLAALLGGALVLTLSLMACVGHDHAGVDVPEGWREVEECSGRLNFALPLDVVEVDPGQPIDSCVGEFEGPSQDFHFDYGAYSNDLSGILEPPNVDPVEWTEVVDGRVARFLTARNPGRTWQLVTGISVREIYPGDSGLLRTHLSFVAHGATDAEREQALAVFRSLDFSR